MNITSAQYYKDKDGVENDGIKMVVNGKTYCVPLSADNADYQAILDWVAEGNSIQDAD